MLYKATHNVFSSCLEFTETTAPSWLTSENTVKGSTMDTRWFWKLVLNMKVGDKLDTDFHTIERLE